MQNTWIFQLKAPLTAAQKSQIESELGPFVRDAWKAHGAPVPGSLEIRYDRFLIVQAEPGQTSGCSIDSMTKTAMATLDAVGAERLEANNVFYKTPAGDIEFLDFREVPAALAAGTLTPDTPVFTTTIAQGESLDAFEQPLSSTWMSRYLVQS